MNVVALGLPRFSTLAVQFLEARAGASSRFVAVDPATRGEKLRCLLRIARADTVLCFWGVVSRSDNRARLLQIALRLRKRVVQLWMGTDVLEAARVQDVYPPFVERCIHLCEAEWTRDELRELGIEALVVPRFPFAKPTPALEDTTMPAGFRVLAYVAAGREDFYRLADLVRLAEECPTVPFSVSGIDRWEDPLPPNVRLLGWVADLDPFFARATVFVRIPRHDGFSYSVREALAWGRHVVASYPYRECRHAPDYASLRDHVTTLKQLFDAGELGTNRPGREYVLREFDADRVYAQLAPYLSRGS